MLKPWGCIAFCLPVVTYAGGDEPLEQSHVEKPDGFISVEDLRAKRDGEQAWGLAAVVRNASIPYATNEVVEAGVIE